METLFVFFNVQLQISLRIGNLQMLLEIELLKSNNNNKKKKKQTTKTKQNQKKKFTKN